MGLRKIAKELQPAVSTKAAWVPGHKDVLGNEKADALANDGSGLLRTATNCSTITRIRRWVKKKRKQIQQENYEDHYPQHYEKWQPDALAMPPELHFPRRSSMGCLRKGQDTGDFIEYHERFGHGTRPVCECGELRPQGHFVECRMVAPFLPEIPENDIRFQYTHLTYLLGYKGYKEYQKLVEETSHYSPPHGYRLTLSCQIET